MTTITNVGLRSKEHKRQATSFLVSSKYLTCLEARKMLFSYLISFIPSTKSKGSFRIPFLSSATWVLRMFWKSLIQNEHISQWPLSKSIPERYLEESKACMTWELHIVIWSQRISCLKIKRSEFVMSVQARFLICPMQEWILPMWLADTTEHLNSSLLAISTTLQLTFGQ